MNILIVDDYNINVILLQDVLEQQHNTIPCNSGIDALAIIDKKEIDIVLLDVLMPEMSGYEVLKIIRQNNKNDLISVILVTAKSQKEDLIKGLDLGANDYIKKPIDTIEVLTKVENQCKLISEKKKAFKYKTYANIHESIIQAQRIQQALLPDKKKLENIFPESFVLYIPKDMINGDFYFISESNAKKTICLIDCLGHGVPAGIITALVYSTLHQKIDIEKYNHIKEVAYRLKSDLAYHFSYSEDSYFPYNEIDGIFCEINYNDNTLSTIGLNRPLILIRKKNKDLIINNKIISPYLSSSDYNLFKIGNIKQSLFSDINEELRESSFKFYQNDSIYLYSDGIFDQLGGEHTIRYTKTKLLHFLLDIQNEKLYQQKNLLYNEFTNWKKREEQTDDISIIGVKL